jgi:hypothetical protein
MTITLNSFQRHHRERARQRLINNLLLIAALGTTAWFAYGYGEKQMAARMGQRVDEVTALTTERDSLRQQVVDLQAAELVSGQKIKELEARYREQIPDDSIGEMVKVLRTKINGGVSRDRMMTLLNAAANPRNCRSRETKRFMISTSLGQGRDSSATFASGAVTVSGEGVNALNEGGQKEAWFDLTKPVTMKFKAIGGKVSVAEGALPLTHNIIDDTLEYRYTIEAGPRGFVAVTGDVCDYTIVPPEVEASAAGGEPTAAEE